MNNYLKALVIFYKKFYLNRNQYQNFPTTYKSTRNLIRTIRTKEIVKKYCKTSSISSTNLQKKPLNELPIWQLWLQGENKTPQFVKNCLTSVRYFCEERKIIVLNEDIIPDYLPDLPDFIIKKYKKGIISRTHYSDIIRICLLTRYGGTWIDASVLLTAKLPQKITDQDLFLFSSLPNNIHQPLHLISNWFIHSQAHHPLLEELKLVLFKYWEENNKLMDYFIFHILFKSIIDEQKEMQKIWQNMYHLSNDKPHLLHGQLGKPVSLDKFKEIKGQSDIHKLTQYQSKDYINQEKETFSQFFHRLSEEEFLEFLIK